MSKFSMARGGTLVVFVAAMCLSFGTQAEEAVHPKTKGYLAVGDVPPRPEKPAMTADEQSKLKKELGAARDRQALKNKGNAAKP
jgi:hypothetical protein